MPRVMLKIGLCSALMSVFLSGCVSGGGNAGRFESYIYDTHNRAQRLEQDVGGPLRELNETTAELVARVDASDEQLRRLGSMAEENQVRLKALEDHLAGLKSTLFRVLEIGPAPSVTVTPPSTGGVADSGEATAPPMAAASPSVEYESANLHYQNAHALFRNKDYAGALNQFDLFMQRYPDDPVSSDALYWKAYCLHMLGRDGEALPEFQRVYQHYPSSNRAATAMFSEGKILIGQGKTDQARELLQRLMKDYPVSLAADDAKAALEKL